MTSRGFIAPFYKGLVQEDDQESWVVMTRQDPNTGQPLTEEAYLNLIERRKAKSPELIQNVVRTHAAALLAHDDRENREWHMISVEGCPQRVGYVLGEHRSVMDFTLRQCVDDCVSHGEGCPERAERVEGHSAPGWLRVKRGGSASASLTGSQIMWQIWDNAVPEALKKGQPRPLLQARSDCTLTEVQAILEECARAGVSNVHAVTHDYHAPRVQRYFDEESQGRNCMVSTPEEIVQHLPMHESVYRFVRDLVKRAALPREIIRRERWNERAYGVLHRVSRIGQRLTGKNLEQWLAHALCRGGESAVVPGTPRT